MTGVDASMGTPFVAAPPARGAVAMFLGDVASVFVLAGRVLRQNWPVLLAVALVGTIVRDGVTVVAGYARYDYGRIGDVVFAFAPLALATSLIVMLLRARSSVPELSRSARPRGGLLGDISALLLPLLVFYVSSRFLETDRQALLDMLNLIQLNIGLNNIGVANPRVMAPQLFTLRGAVALFAAIVGLRWLTRSSAFARRSRLIGIPGAYFEVLWLVLGLTFVNQLIATVRGWVVHRTVWTASASWLHGDFSGAGLFGNLLRVVIAGWSAGWSVLGTGLLLPVSAIAAGAVVYGVRTAEPEQEAQHQAQGGAMRATGRAIVRIPRNAIVSRFGPTVASIRLLVRAGLVPMLAFCLGFVALGLAPDWLFALERLLVGSHELTIWYAVGRLLNRFNDAVYLTLLVCLIAGAVGHVARRLAALAPSPAPSLALESPPSGRVEQEIPGLLRQDLDPQGGWLGAGR